MSSTYRTVAAGLGAGAICFVMASLKWQHLLLFFALAGVGWALWTWIKSSQARPSTRPEMQHRSRVRASDARQSGDNVYQFPSRTWNISDATGS